GFTHARVPVDPVWLWDGEAGALLPERVRSLKRGVSRLNDAGLAAIVEVHPLGDTWPSPTTKVGAERLRELWRQLAPVLADTDPARVVLELLNEPHDFADAEAWATLQKELHAI